MRDIRSDLQERANRMEDQIRVLHAHCEKMVKQLQTERDAKVAEVRSKLEMIHKLIELENQDTSNAPPVMAPVASAPPPLAQVVGLKK